MVAAVGAVQPISFWANVKRVANDPKISSIVGAVGLAVGLIYKIQLVAILAIHIFVWSLFGVYDQYRQRKLLVGFEQKERLFDRTVLEMRNLIDGDQVIEPEDLCNQFKGKIETLKEADVPFVYSLELKLRIAQAQYEMRIERGMGERALAVLKRDLFEIHRQAIDERPDYGSWKAASRNQIDRGMNWFKT